MSVCVKRFIILLCLTCFSVGYAFKIPLSAAQKRAEHKQAVHYYQQGLKFDKAGQYVKANITYRQAASLHYAIAMTRIGDLYRLGHGVTKDASMAQRWYLVGMRVGDAYGAAYQLGQLYFSGQLGKADYHQAVRYFAISANADNPQAEYYLGTLFLKGLGTDQNAKSALYWCQKAFQSGVKPAAVCVFQAKKELA